jgi:hypothetical protein
MAIKWPLANGNWSNAANWNDGTLPDIGDDVHADGKTVTIDQDVTVLSIRNDQRSGGTNGGTFIVTGDFIINSNLIVASSTLITYSGDGSLNINGNLILIANSISLLTKNGLGVININGNLSLGSTSVTGRVISNNVGIINLNGIINDSRSLGATDSIIVNSSGATFNFNGTIIAPISTSTNNSSVAISNSGTLNILGVVNGGAGNALFGSILNNGFLYVNGIIRAITATSPKPAIYSASVSAITIIQGNIESCPYGYYPISVRRLNYVASANTTITFADNSTNGQLPPAEPPTTFTLYSADIVIDAPQASDVRKDVVYADGVLTGTLAVPNPSNVRKDIPTDNTVGTAELTGEDIAEGILNAIQSSENPVAERLRNVSTVQTTGDQIAGS